ncbi:MAG TPA: cytochrome c-type biogenesis protein [Nitrospiria bacterium]|jgi:cytochrome c-type biogenesis protein CcmH|nr:cytochrome c-type biogenesis protein [Nitrospiria bacterium]
MKRFLIIAVLFMIAAPAVAAAGTVDEQTIDIRTREIAKTLRCTVCQSESVFESQAPLAQQMRGVIRERVAQGQSDEEIRAYFLSRYGDYILMEPRRTGMNWLIWAGPFLLLFIGGLFLYRTLARWAAQTASAPPEDLPPLDDISRQRIDRELRSLPK